MGWANGMGQRRRNICFCVALASADVLGAMAALGAGAGSSWQMQINKRPRDFERGRYYSPVLGGGKNKKWFWEATLKAVGGPRGRAEPLALCSRAELRLLGSHGVSAG